MKQISKLPNIETNIFTVMSAFAVKHDALNLSQGFPNFKSDSKLIEMVYKAMRDGFNQYAPMAGIFELREQIAIKYNLLYQSTYNPEFEITITAGATQAISCILSAFINKGDEVIIFKPAYDCYEPFVELNGGIAVDVQLEAPHYSIDWKLVEEKISSKTKMIVINSPHNPSGRVFSENDMMQLQALTKETNIIVLSDEVYEHIIFDKEQHQSVCLFPNLKERSFVVGSFGKTFHNTGWKMGYCCAPKQLMEEFRKVHQFNVFSVNHPIQVALAKYIKTPSNYLELSQLFEEKRNLFLSLIEGSRFKFIPAKGTYFQALNYSEITEENDVELAKRWTVEKGIASIPFSVFNENKKDDKMLRFCFAKTDETLKRGTDILNSI